MTTVDIKEWSAWNRAWQETQKDKQPHGKKVIQKWKARAQTFAANTGNVGQKRTENVYSKDSVWKMRIYNAKPISLTILPKYSRC